MRSFFLFPLLGVLAYAQTIPLASYNTTCQCPLVKCDANTTENLCACLNNRESICKRHCPDYEPIYRPCPMPISSVTPEPTSESTSEPTPGCQCEAMFCIQAWPDSCYCENAGKQDCHKKCGGVEPELQSCPPRSTKSLETTTRPTRTLTPKPTGTHAPCGGSRANPYPGCEDGYICIKDPYKPGCGPECDGAGICVFEEMCGGFAGFPCPDTDMDCIDNAADDCDPEQGGADCGGLCVWPH